MSATARRLASPALDRVLDLLRDRGTVTKHGREWRCLCPAHDDTSPSLDVTAGEDGRVLFQCRSRGCPAAAIAAALNLSFSDLFADTATAGATSFEQRIVRTYDYRDETGKVLFQAVRLWAPAPKNKDFRQRRPDGKGGWTWKLGDVRKVIYRLPELLAADITDLVFVVEGEKDADTLARCGLIATTSPMGAGKWKQDYASWFAGRHVILLPDNDDAGRDHAEDVRKSLAGTAASIKVIGLPGLPDKGDVTDWVDDQASGAGECVDWHGIGRALWRMCTESQVLSPERNGVHHAPHITNGKPHNVSELLVESLEGLMPKPVHWLVQNRIPAGMMGLIAGEGGHGKSTTTLNLAAPITSGRCAFGLTYPNPVSGKVLLISCEDDWERTIIPRLAALGADLSRVLRVRGVRMKKDGQTLDFHLGHFQELEALLRTNPDIRLVVIDPAGAYVGRAGINENRDADLRAVLGPLSEAANRTGATVILVKHLNKSAGVSAVQRVSGSTGYVNAVRFAYMILPDPDDRDLKLMLPIKANVLPAGQSGLAYRLESIPHTEARTILLSRWPGLDSADLDALAEQLFRQRWEEGSTMDADHAIGRKSERKDDPNKVEKCAEFLREFLK